MRWFRKNSSQKATEKLVREAALDVLLAHINENYDKWEQGNHWFTHPKSGVQIWTANGINHIEIEMAKDGTKITRENIPEEYRKKIVEAISPTNRSYRKLVESLR